MLRTICRWLLKIFTMETAWAVLVVFQPRRKKKSFSWYSIRTLLYFSHRLQNGYLLHCGLLWVAEAQTVSPCFPPQGSRISFPAPESPSLPPSNLDVCRVACLSQLLLDVFFLPSLDYVITGALAPLMFSSALVSSESVLEPSGSSSLWHGGFLKAYQSQTCSPPAPQLI